MSTDPEHNNTDKPLALVSFAMAPGPGGPEAAVSREFLRGLVGHWRAPLTVYSAGNDPGLVADRLDLFAAQATHPASLSSNERRWLALSNQAARSRWSPGRLLSRILYERSGYSIKYHVWERWVAPRLAALLDQKADAVVYSRALPLSSLNAAYRVVSSRLNPWIVNLNDPCPPGLLTGLYPMDNKTLRLQARTFERLLPRIDAFSFPCKRLMQIHVDAYPAILRKPVRIIPHLAPALDIPATPEPKRGRARKIRFGFAGTLRTSRSHPALLEALQRLHTLTDAQVELHAFLTVDSPALDALAERSPIPINIESSLDGPDIDQRLHAMDVLLDIESAEDGPLLMTKVVSYLRFAKPVLALCAEEGTTWELLQSTQRGVAVPYDSVEEITRGFIETIGLATSNEPQQHSDHLELFAEGTVVAALRQLIREIENGNKGLQGPDRP